MSGQADIVFDEHGAPALLQGATTIDPNTRSGNPHHEISSGRFGRAPGGGVRSRGSGPSRAPSPPSLPPADKARSSQVRRRDALIDAARTLDDLSPDGVREFVTRRWAGTRVLTDSDVQSFSEDAQRQRIEDVIDALDYRVRRGVFGRQRIIRVELPRGLARQTIRGLSDDEISSVLRRLRERGWSADQLRKHVVRTFDDKDKRMTAELRGLQ